ncbi:MAG TPA: SDR family oxidoreductase [Verrucomicrobiae bacterium]|nr:SDR family oxidoreductase [Verrucomicrobiae bacterium]
MNAFQRLKDQLLAEPKVWLVTGSAGFIGSNLVESLLQLGQRVVGLDNYATGSVRNLNQVRDLAGLQMWKNFRQIDGDIRDAAVCKQAASGVDYILHQAALGSVPRSIENPLLSHECNVTGFLNMVMAARDGGAKRFVYASSSSVYGDHPDLPKVEEKIGHCLSPYAATKRANEIYADAAVRCYGLQAVGLRYFNVFGPRQDPDGPYAAVIPKWVAAMIKGGQVIINGDGETSRDFCYIANVVQANLLAATSPMEKGAAEVFNVAVHARTTLNELFGFLKDGLAPHYPQLRDLKPVYRDFRSGDVRHSEANISKAARLLGYEPTHTIQQGLGEALDWYRQNLV